MSVSLNLSSPARACLRCDEQVTRTRGMTNEHMSIVQSQVCLLNQSSFTCLKMFANQVSDSEEHVCYKSLEASL